MFIYITDAIDSKQSPQKRMIHPSLHDVRSALQATLINHFLQFRREAVRVDARKQEAARLAIRQHVNKLLQPERLFPLKGSTVFFVGGNVMKQRFP